MFFPAFVCAFLNLEIFKKKDNVVNYELSIFFYRKILFLFSNIAYCVQYIYNFVQQLFNKVISFILMCVLCLLLHSFEEVIFGKTGFSVRGE